MLARSQIEMFAASKAGDRARSNRAYRARNELLGIRSRDWVFSLWPRGVMAAALAFAALGVIAVFERSFASAIGASVAAFVVVSVGYHVSRIRRPIIVAGVAIVLIWVSTILLRN
jgi:hypothetical protein